MAATATMARPKAPFYRSRTSRNYRRTAENALFAGLFRTFYYRKPCIKNVVLIDQTCGSGGFFYKGYNFVELYNPSADVLLFVRASNAEIYAMRLSYVAL